MNIYKVEGMTCGGCATSVTKAIQLLAPKAEVQIDLEAKSVQVKGLDDANAIKKAIEEAGFDFCGTL